MKVICTRNNAEFEFVRMEGEDYVLADPQTGKEKIINEKAYNRFYKEVEEVEAEDAVEEVVKDDVEEVKEEEKPAKAKKASTKEPKQTKAEKVKEPKQPREISPLKDIVEKIIIAADCTIFETQVKGFHTFKVGTHMCMAMTFSTKGVVLWLRTKVLEGLDLKINYKPMKHMFDARLPMTEVSDENVALIRRLVAAHVEYQKGVNQQRADKLAKQEANRQKRAEKAEAKKKEEMAKKLGVKTKKVETEEE